MPTLSSLPTLRQRLRFLLLECDTVAAEWLTAFRSVAWGCWQAFGPHHRLAGDAWTSAVFRQLLPPWAWGALVLLLGAGHLTLILGGWRTWRRWAGFASFLIWGYVFCLYAFSGTATAATPTHLVTVLASAWIYLRLGGRPCTPV